MKDEELLALVKAAMELDELECTVTGREGLGMQRAPEVGKRRTIRWWMIGIPIVAVAAVIAWLVLA